MFTSLRVQNFQALRQQMFELDPHVTVIVGPNDVGKSSFMRALRWVCLNLPNGDAFRTWGTAKTSVTLEADDHTVRRIRGARNLYKLDGATFAAFSNGVPEEVASLLSVSSLNFQRQHDAHFWFANTAGHVSRELNRIVALDSMDAAIKSASAKERELRSLVTVTEQRLESARKRKLDLSWTLEAEADLQEVEVLERELLTRTRKRDDLSSLIVRVQGAAITLGRKDKARRMLEKAMEQWEANVEPLRSKLERLKQRRDRLALLLQRIQETKDRICQKKQEAKKLHTQCADMASTLSCPLCGQPMSPPSL
jgi:chromosome segregation ATPase